MKTRSGPSCLALVSLTLIAGCGTSMGQSCRSDGDCGEGDLACTDSAGAHGARAVGPLSCNRTCTSTADCGDGYCDVHHRDGQPTGICVYPDSDSDVAAVDIGGDDGADPGTYFPDDGTSGGGDGSGDDGSDGDGDGGGCDDCATHHRAPSRGSKQATRSTVKVGASQS